MTRKLFVTATYYSLIGISVVSSGCITLNAPSGLAKSLQKPKVEQASFEQEEVTEVPSKLKNPKELKLKYALLMEEMNQLVEAREKYQEVIEADPKNVDATLGLARIDQATGQFTEAEQKYKKAIRLAPDLATAHFQLGQLYVAQNDWTDAIGPLTDAMLSEPENLDYRFQLAVALMNIGDVESALPHFIRTVGDAEAHYNVAMILKDRGQNAEAERHFELAVTKKPEFEQAQYWLSHLRRQRRERMDSQRGVGSNEVTQDIPNRQAARKRGSTLSEANGSIKGSSRIVRPQLASIWNQPVLSETLTD